MIDLKLPHIFVVYRNEKPVKSKRGKLYHHAKQHAASSIKQLAEDLIHLHISRLDYPSLDEYWKARKITLEEIKNTFGIREFELREIQ